MFSGFEYLTEVSKEDFFRTVGALNVHPKVREASLKNREHISDWKLPNGRCVGVSVNDSHGGRPSKFYVPKHEI